MGRWGKRDDMIVHEADPYNAEPPSLDGLRTGFPARTLTATLQCAGNRRTGLMAVRDAS